MIDTCFLKEDLLIKNDINLAPYIHLLKAQFKFQLTKDEFSSIKNTYYMTKLPKLAKPFPYTFTLLISRHMKKYVFYVDCLQIKM